MRTFRPGRGALTAVALLGAVVASVPRAASASFGRECRDNLPPMGPGMEQSGFFPFAPGGPPIACIHPVAWMAPLYAVDLLMGTLGVVKGIREGWPGERWQVAAAILGAGQLIGGSVMLIGALRDENGDGDPDLDPAWLPHGVILLGAGTALVTTALLAGVLRKPPPVAASPIVLRDGGGVLLTLRF